MNKIEQYYQQESVVIVPGGGFFADQVRLAQQHWQFDDRTAHCMAVLAMQQMALMIVGLKRDFVVAPSVQDICRYGGKGKSVVWSPDIIELDTAGVAATWDITSDSLAVWLAKAIAAEQLLVVKSADINANLSFQELAEQDIVDKAFCHFTAQATFKIQIINAQSW